MATISTVALPDIEIAWGAVQDEGWRAFEQKYPAVDLNRTVNNRVHPQVLAGFYCFVCKFKC